MFSKSNATFCTGIFYKLIIFFVLKTNGFSVTAETKKWEKLKRLPSCSLRVALSRYLDICSPPSQRLLEVFSQNTTNTTEKNKLIELSQVKFLMYIY